MERRIVCLMGPTASGKTDLAIALCQRFPFEIISVDSALVFRDMDIGTAKPSAEELAKAPHRLISFLDPAESYSVAQFRADALQHINQVWQNGKIPLLVGGTMLYFRTLLLGMSDLPEADPSVRAEIDQLAQQHGWAHVHQLLAEVDPVSASRLRSSDPQRVQRALEVYRISGKPMSEFQTQTQDHKTDTPVYADDIGLNPIQIAIMPEDRAVLHQRIERRFHTMVEQGFEQEVRALYQRGDLHAGLPSVRAVGYRQMWSYLDGDIDYDEMTYRGIVATRQLAKRQLTWLRNWQGLQVFQTDPTNRSVIDQLGQLTPLNETISRYLQENIDKLSS